MRDVGIDFTGASARRPSRFLVRLEQQRGDFIVSPLLGEGRLCEICWMLRRIATLDPSELCAEASNGADLVTAFQRNNALAGRPREPAQRTAIARTLRARIHEARTALSASFPPSLTRITPSGFGHSEPVLPLPGCVRCGEGPTRGSAGPLESVVGQSAGIVADLKEISPLEGEPVFPHVVISRLANTFLEIGRPFWAGASGKGAVREAAIGSAVGEALERYAARIVTKRLVIARATQLVSAIHPRRLTGVEASQAKEAGYDPDCEIAWVQGISTRDPSRTAWLPASAVYLRLPPEFRGQFAVPAASNGLACAPTLEEAIDRGFAEVIERHAFFSVWYGLREAELGDAGRYVDDFSVVDSFRACRLELRTALLATLGDVIVASASCWPLDNARPRPGFALGLGSGKEAAAAVRGSLLEVAQVYRGLTWALRDPSLRERAELLKREPSMANEPYDHGLLYSSRTPDTVPSPFGLAPSRFVSSARVSPFGDAPGDAFFVDLTPTDVARASSWHVVRVAVPDLIPFHFGPAMIPRALLCLPSPEKAPSTELLHPLS